MSDAPRCSTCRSPWRGATVCPRCGADLGAVMRVAARAWQLREAARTALSAGEQPTEALALARAACRLHDTPLGQRLLALALLAGDRRTEAARLITPLLSADPPGPEAEPTAPA